VSESKGSEPPRAAQVASTHFDGKAALSWRLDSTYLDAILNSLTSFINSSHIRRLFPLLLVREVYLAPSTFSDLKLVHFKLM